MNNFSFKPMLCSAIDILPEEQEAFIAEIKWDGWRAIATIDQNTTLETRNQNLITSVPYLLNELSAIFPDSTVVDGEIIDGEDIVHGWNNVQTICSSQTPHVPTTNSPCLKYVIFDILYYRGKDVRNLSWNQRRDILEECFTSIDNNSNLMISSIYAPQKEWYDDIIKKGYEGIVIKRKNSPYVGGRSGAWNKIKPQTHQNQEAEIIGLPLEGKGKYENMVGSIEFKLANGIKGHCSGFSDQIRKELTENPEQYMGKIIEISHWGINKNNTLRHPQFHRMRLDRDALELKQSQTIFTQKTKKPRKAKTSASKPKMRNYKAMGDKKLLDCFKSLQNKTGDAYDRCINGGSREPEKDLQVVIQLITEKNLCA